VSREEVRRVLEEVSGRWLGDPQADVIWVGDYEGRRGVRVRLGTGDPSTVWFQVGERTLRVEAFMIPAPPAGRREEVYRRSLAYNSAVRRLHLALDRRGDLVLVGRVPLGEVDAGELELLLGEAHQALEVVRPALARVAFEREKPP
jgi:hypothetical protein